MIGTVTWVARQLFAVLVLPFTVAVVIPVWIARRDGVVFHGGATPFEWMQQIGGLCALAIGMALFVASLRRFISDGRGTLAPWDPPRRLVVRGPYRYVRNPMISGVSFVLVGEALLWLSRPHLTWALIFVGINCVYIPLLEEPMLAARFGDDYRVYRSHVPRLIPRLRPWTDRQPPVSPPSDTRAKRAHRRS